MKTPLGNSSPQRENRAIGICCVAALMLILKPLSSGGYTWGGMTPEQYFSISKVFASLGVFQGSSIMARIFSQAVSGYGHG